MAPRRSAAAKTTTPPPADPPVGQSAPDITEAYAEISREAFEARAALWRLVSAESAYRRGEGPAPDRREIARIGTALGLGHSDVEEWVRAVDTIAGLHRCASSFRADDAARITSKARRYACALVVRDATEVIRAMETREDHAMRRAIAACTDSARAQHALQDAAPPFLVDELRAAKVAAATARNSHAVAEREVAELRATEEQLARDLVGQYANQSIKWSNRELYDRWCRLTATHREQFAAGDPAQEATSKELVEVRREIIEHDSTEWSAWVAEHGPLTDVRYSITAATSRLAAAELSLRSAESHLARVSAMVAELMPAPVADTDAPTPAPDHRRHTVDLWTEILAVIQTRLATAQAELA